jgi:ribosomal protein L12E/L44/L45/RPP1/RPP2
LGGFGDDDEFEKEMEAMSQHPPAAPAATAAAAPTAATAPGATSELDDDESDDTVKSINDALRGLFR